MRVHNRVVRIDHDIPYHLYDTHFLQEWVKQIPYPVREMYMRESTGGNTHIKLVMWHEISPLDELMIRAVMHDDPKRIRGDLERYLFDSPIFGLLFDEKKFSDGTTLKCGEWVKI